MRPESWRMDRQRWMTGLAGLCALLMAGQGGYCLSRVLMSQHTLDHAFVGQQAEREISAALLEGRGSGVLRSVLAGLLQRGELGLNSLAVHDSEGILLSRVGVLESFHLPVVPEALQDRARDLFYDLIGSAGTRRLYSPEHRLLGQVDYTIAPGAVEGVREAANETLRLVGWTSAGLALPLLAMFVLGVRRQRREAPSWLLRADPSAMSGADTAVPAPEEFRARAGQVMDALEYALILAGRDGQVRHCNAVAERLTGWPLQDVKGRPLFTMLHFVDDAGSPMPSPADEVMQTGSRLPPTLVHLRSRSGEVMPIELMASPWRNRQGGTDGVAVLFRDASRQAREADALRREARLSQAVVDHLEEGLLTTDIAGVVRSANARAQRMFGYPREELVGSTVTKLMPVPFLNTPSVRISDYVANRRATAHLPKVVGWRKDATTFPVELWVQPMRADGAEGLVVVVRDISERLRGENLASRLGRLLDNAAEEIYIFDAQSLNFLEVNRGARSNLGYKADELERMTPLDISADLEEEVFQAYLSKLRGGEQDHLVYRCQHRRSDATAYPVEVRLNFSRQEEPPVFMAIAADISERIAAEDKLNRLAHFDALTGLPNRVMLYDRLQQALLATERDPRLLGVFFLDLDRFKQINDLHGHEAGDQVLKAVADRLVSTMRPSDTVARLAGDEFVILAPGLRSPDDAAALAQKLLDRFAQPLDLPGLSITSRPSIGITLYPIDDSDLEGLLRHADNAMYEAKQAGRGCYRMFSTEVDPERRRRLELEREIHAGVALNQFRLKVAPAMARDGRPVALLTSLSWQHPRYGEVLQTEVLQAAARAGLVADMELWLICQVCEYFASGPGRASELPAVVSVSGWQLRDREFVAHVLELLDRYQVSGERLVLALTPDGFVEARTRHADARKLFERGMRLGLRDFNVFPELDDERAPCLALVDAGARDGSRVLAELARTAPAEIKLIATGLRDSDAVAAATAAGARYLAGTALVPAEDPDGVAHWLQAQE